MYKDDIRTKSSHISLILGKCTFFFGRTYQRHSTKKFMYPTSGAQELVQLQEIPNCLLDTEQCCGAPALDREYQRA
ncbi:hypothetical protein Y032_0008g304 [Ancylostoma ceylanicum]|uniref:Uncharacterized protein n=1 Tax=Ancylostoma ceylanicum TaxID=53326 RepID=A0A016VMT7_9BILA|nr:hypothetical protein Y032_0008g304 [Ancylostoma ceylanicum]